MMIGMLYTTQDSA